MNTVKVRNIEIGAGIPKICVPIVGVTREEILAAAENIKSTKADVVEWRVDWYEDIFDFAKTEATMQALREVIGEMPILFTFRTSKEGGEKAIETGAYVELNQNAAKTGLIDLVDVEAFTGDEAVKAVVGTAHASFAFWICTEKSVLLSAVNASAATTSSPFAFASVANV